MSQILKTEKNGHLLVDMDFFAEKLGIGLKDLKIELQNLALLHIINEADRLNAVDYFGKKIFPHPPKTDAHIIAAAKSLLEL